MAFTLALVSGFFHAAWNAIAHRQANERAAAVVSFTLAGVVTLVGVALVPGQHLPLAAWPHWLLAGLGEVAYVYCLGQAYQRGDLALTYTASRAFALVVIWPLSFVVFGSTPTATSVLATALVGLGIGLGRGGARHGSTVAWSWTLATGAAVGAYHTGYKGLVEAGATPLAAFGAAVVLAVPLLLLSVGPAVRRAALGLVWRPWLWVSGTLSAASFLLLVWALVTADSGRMLGVRNSSVGFALLFGLAQGERLDRRQWLGVLLLFAGVAAFALAELRP